MSVRFAIVTLGSAGDLYPFLAIARELARRGHQVELLSNAPYEQVVHSEGVAFHAICSEHDHERTRTHPRLWHPIDGLGVLWRYMAVPALRPTYERLRQLVEAAPSEPLTVLASPLSLGARLARDALPLRLLTGYTAPANLRSQEGTWYLGAWRVPAGLPDWARRSAWWAVDRWKLEPMARPALDSMRESLGLPEPRGSTFGDWMHAPDGGLALFPSWFCAPMRGWPALRFAGFPLFEPSDSRPSDPALEAFLSSDAPPIAFFPGSAGTGRSLLSLVHSAASDLGLRVLLLGGEAAGAADPSLYAAGDVVLSNVLPRTALFIHHGGIGSCAQGLAHRIPQLILPSAFDQFDNALRIEALGAGLWQRPSKADYTELIARALRLAPPGRDLRVSTPSKPNDAVSLCCDYLDKQKSPEP